MIRSMEGLQALKERRSVRSYQPRQIAEEDLQAILQVVTDGPTAHNKQLYHFTVVQDKALLDNILYSGVWVNYRGKRKEEAANDG